MEILDNIEEKILKPKNLNRAKLLFKLCIGIFLFSIIITAFIKPIFKGELEDTIDLLIGFPVLGIIFISPVGSILQYKKYNI